VRDRHTGRRPAGRARATSRCAVSLAREPPRVRGGAGADRGIPTYVYKGLGFFDADEIKDTTALLRYLADPASDLRAAALMRSRLVGLSDRALALLAPRLAAALTSPDPPPALGSLAALDRRVLEHVRVRVGGWLARVDRVPPAELLDEVLTSTAYAFELRGGRRQQAWENLKKMRGLVRRVQNRGYATLTRIAGHIDALSAGDESNAVIEALEAVNLMTVHASKGLEFPVVFVVNLAKGASGPPQPIRVIADGLGGEPSVSVGPFVSETDEIEREREKEETKRLMYVALTRARDRLYLSSVLKDGALQPGRGSLAEVLPDSVRQVFANAATAFEACDTVAWAGRSGRTFEFRLCRPPAAEAAGPPPVSAATPLERGEDRFEPAPATGDVPRVSVTASIHHESREGSRDFDDVARRSSTIEGTLIHRLFRHAAAFEVLPTEPAAVLARRLLDAEELAAVPDVDALVHAALEAWRRLRTRADVAGLLASGRALFEVPFSLRREGADDVILRGAIDCLIVRPDGVTVVEFKTGTRRAAHQRQLDVYLEAARLLFPTPVEGRLIYAEAD
jgi:ATP-dependent exoDNAse (exonuclease V) beta subunit